MIRISFLYPAGEDASFNFDYFINTHVTMAYERFGPVLREYTLGRGMPTTEGSPPAYPAVCHVLTDSIEEFNQAYAPHADAMRADVANYTNIFPIIQVGDVVFEQRAAGPR
jgi:uncharacterized protein (TIGR02118 family)